MVSPEYSGILHLMRWLRGAEMDLLFCISHQNCNCWWGFMGWYKNCPLWQPPGTTEYATRVGTLLKRQVSAIRSKRASFPHNDSFHAWTTVLNYAPSKFLSPCSNFKCCSIYLLWSQGMHIQYHRMKPCRYLLQLRYRWQRNGYDNNGIIAVHVLHVHTIPVIYSEDLLSCSVFSKLCSVPWNSQY